MTRRALIFGITGQDGSYLAELLLSRGYEVHGTHRRSSVDNLVRIAGIRDRVTLHRADLADPLSMQRAIQRSDPDECYNLADQDHVGWSHDTPGYSAAVTYGAVGTLLEMLKGRERVRFFQPISSTVFGDACTVDEDTPLAPASPYAVAKAAAWLACKHYRREHNLHVCCGVMFNHDSPRRGPDYLLQRIARGAVAIHWGERKTLDLWSLDGSVDVGYAPEYMVAAYRMMQMKTPDDFVIATAQPEGVRRLVSHALTTVGLKGEPEDYLSEETKAGPSAGFMNADISKAKVVLDFVPKWDATKVVELLVKHFLEGNK